MLRRVRPLDAVPVAGRSHSDSESLPVVYQASQASRSPLLHTVRTYMCDIDSEADIQLLAQVKVDIREILSFSQSPTRSHTKDLLDTTTGRYTSRWGFFQCSYIRAWAVDLPSKYRIPVTHHAEGCCG